MIETKKIIQGMDRKMPFSFSHSTRARGHLLKLNVGRVMTEKENIFYPLSNWAVELLAIGYSDGIWPRCR